MKMNKILIVSLILLSSVFILGCVNEAETTNDQTDVSELPNNEITDLDMMIVTIKITYADGSTETVDRVIDWVRISMVVDEVTSIHYKILDDNDYGKIVVVHNVMTVEHLHQETITLTDITMDHVDSYTAHIVTEENTQYN